MKQAFDLRNGEANFGVGDFSDNFEKAAKPTKIMMTYNIFQGALKLAERQVEVNLKTMKTMLGCIDGGGSDCEGSKKYIEEVKVQSQSMYSIREANGFSLTAAKSPEPIKGAPVTSFALVEEDDPALSIIAKYPILSQFPSQKVATDEEFQNEFKDALQKMADAASDKLSEFPDMDYYDVIDFPGSIAMSLLDQISALQNSGDLNAPMVAGSYCELVSEIYKKHEYLDTVTSIAAAIGAGILGLITAPFGVVVGITGAIVGLSGEVYLEYSNYQNAVFRCETAVGSQPNADQCTAQEYASISSMKPSTASVATQAILGVAGFGLGRQVGRVMTKAAKSTKTTLQKVGSVIGSGATCAIQGASLTGCSMFSGLFAGLGTAFRTVAPSGAMKYGYSGNKNITIAVKKFYGDGPDIDKANTEIFVIIKKETFGFKAGSAGYTDSAEAAYDYEKFLSKSHKSFGTKGGSYEQVKAYGDRVEAANRRATTIAVNQEKASVQSGADSAEDLIQAFRDETGFQGKVFVEEVGISRSGETAFTTADNLQLQEIQGGVTWQLEGKAAKEWSDFPAVVN